MNAIDFNHLAGSAAALLAAGFWAYSCWSAAVALASIPDPSDGKRFNIGIGYGMLKNYPAAIEAFRRAAALNKKGTPSVR